MESDHRHFQLACARDVLVRVDRGQLALSRVALRSRCIAWPLVDRAGRLKVESWSMKDMAGGVVEVCRGSDRS